MRVIMRVVMMGLTMGFGRLTEWLRPSGTMNTVDLSTRITADLDAVEPERLVEEISVVQQALDLMTENRQHALTRLGHTITRFRSAFESPAGRVKTLQHAWNVQQAWHNLRTIEDTLHTLSMERQNIQGMLGGAGFPPPPNRPAHAAAAA